jgi:hypothetical protein
MSMRMIAETGCECCGKIERKEQETRYTPPGWRNVWVGYYVDRKITPECSKLLCPDCLARVKAAMDWRYHHQREGDGPWEGV